MSCFDVKILEPDINTIEIETCIGDQPSSISIITFDNTSILEINNCVALLPSDFNDYITVKDIIAGSGIAVISSSGIYTISLSDTNLTSSDISDFLESVQDIIGQSGLSAGNYINLIYNNTTGLTTISVTGVQPSGNYSLVGHTHVTNDITNFSSGVSGLLPSVTGTGYATSNFANNVYTISVTGVQPSGNYSLVGHNHISTDITDFNSAVSGLLPTISNSGDNRLLTSTGTSTGINAESNATFNGTTLAVSGVIVVDNLQLDGNTLSSINNNGNIIIQPSGTGAIQRDSDGDTRGQYAIDWQTSRNNNAKVASGNYSVIGGGSNNTASGIGSTINGGNNNIANGDNSTIVGGQSNTASNIFGTVCGGRYNTVSAKDGTIGGGKSNTVSGYAATVGGGFYNTSSNYYSTIGGGQSNNCSGYWAVIGGGYYNSNTSFYGTIGGGFNNTCNGDGASTISGGQFNQTNSRNTTISGGESNNCDGEWSVIGGGWSNNITGNNATIGGGRKNTITGVLATIAGGNNNTIIGSYGGFIGGGYNNYIDSILYGTITGGQDNINTANYSTIIGGRSAKASRYGEVSHSAGSFANKGDSQHSILILRRSTTNSTPIPLTLDGINPSPANRMFLPPQTSWSFSIKVSAYNSTDNQAAWWIIRGGIRRDASNGTSLVGSLITENGAESSLSGASVAVAADDTNEALEIQVTGITSKTIRWTAVVDISQVSFGTP